MTKIIKNQSDGKRMSLLSNQFNLSNSNHKTTHADHVNHHQREIQFPRAFFHSCARYQTVSIAVQDAGPLDRYFGKREKHRFDQVE